MTQTFDKSDIHYFVLKARNYEANLRKAMLRDSFDIPRHYQSISYIRSEYKKIRKQIYTIRKAEAAFLAAKENQQFIEISVYPNVT